MPLKFGPPPSSRTNTVGVCVLMRIVHMVAAAPEDRDVFFAKWDVKDGFWRMVCELGAEWNFCYVLPQPEGAEPLIVMPMSLQMGWLESPAYFGAASETARDVGQMYAQAPLGSLPTHKFDSFTAAHEDYASLPQSADDDERFQYGLEVFVDDFIGLAVPASQRQLDHVSRAAMHGMHDVFPPSKDDENDPNSLKKLRNGDGAWARDKDVLGFDFDGKGKSMILGIKNKLA